MPLFSKVSATQRVWELCEKERVLDSVRAEGCGGRNNKQKWWEFLVCSLQRCRMRVSCYTLSVTGCVWCCVFVESSQGLESYAAAPVGWHAALIEGGRWQAGSVNE